MTRTELARQLWFWHSRDVEGPEHAQTFKGTTYTEADWDELLIPEQQARWLERADRVLTFRLTKTPAVLVGLGIGDALGAHFETLGDDVHPELAKWKGDYRACTRLGLPAGHTTDDSAMAECLAASIVEHGKFDGEDVSKRYLAWAQGTPHGIGGTTRKALDQIACGVSWRESGISFDTPHAVGSAPAMRAAPIGALCAAQAEEGALATVRAVGTCMHDANITHADPEAVVSSLAVTFAVRGMLLGKSPLETLDDVLAVIASEYLPTLVDSALRRIPDALAKGWPPRVFVESYAGRRGNAWQITSTAMYCALWATSYREGVVEAVRIGGDADTRGAIAGAILGARFGLEDIPEEYQKGLLDFKRLHALDLALTRKL
jgi:ADP-ribosyl-[dinitrogen reductase] hydrolase